MERGDFWFITENGMPLIPKCPSFAQNKIESWKGIFVHPLNHWLIQIRDICGWKMFVHDWITCINHIHHLQGGIFVCWWIFVGDNKCLYCLLGYFLRQYYIEQVGRYIKEISCYSDPKSWLCKLWMVAIIIHSLIHTKNSQYESICFL